MKRTIAIGAVIAAVAAAILLRAPSETDTTPTPALRGTTDVAPATPQSDLAKPDLSAAGRPAAESTAATPSETAAPSATPATETHPAVPTNEPRSDAIVPPVKRSKPKDPVLAGDPVEEPKKGAKTLPKPEPAKSPSKP